MKKKSVLFGSTILLTSSLLLAGCFGESEQEKKLSQVEVHDGQGGTKVIEAEDVNAVLYQYIEEENGELTLTNYLGTNPHVVIPEQINGKPVTKIQGIILRYNKDNQQEIVRHSFNGRGISSVVFPPTLKEIGYGAFYENELTSVKIPSSVEVIDELAFSKNLIEKVEFEEGIKKVSKSAFANNYIKELTLPNSMEEIGISAFYNNKISSLTLNDNLKVIEDSAFEMNTIEKLNVPKSVSYIGSFAFKNNLIKELTLNEGLEIIGRDSFHTNRLLDISIPSSVKSIYGGAFKNNNFMGNSIDLSKFKGNYDRSSFDDGVLKLQ